MAPGAVETQNELDPSKAHDRAPMEQRDESDRSARGRAERGRGVHAPLELRRPMRFLGWLRGPRSKQRLISSLWGRLGGLVLLTVVLGTWGFRRLDVSPRLSWEQSIYHAVRLFTIDLGPAGGGVRSASGHSVGLNWQLRLAFLAAALVILRALLAVAREHLRRRFMRHLLSGHAIVCGGGVHGARLVSELADAHDVVLVDVDPGAPGLQETRGEHEWRLIGDATAAETLLWAGVERAHWIVAVSGNDYLNSQIVSVVRALARDGNVTDGVHALVQIEDPALERFLEEGELEDEAAKPTGGGTAVPAPKITVFGGNAIAASALFGEGPAASASNGDERAPLVAVEQEGPHARRLLLLVGDHPLLDAIVLAALRRLRGYKMRALEEGTGRYVPTLRIGLIGPDAVERATRIKERWLPESSLLELEGKDLAPGEEKSLEADRWLRDRRLPGHALVACLEELDGIGLTLAMSRALGSGAPLTRVTAQPESELDHHLEAHTEHSPYLATTHVRSISDLAWAGNGIRRILVRERLICALRDVGVADAVVRADGLLDGHLVDLHSDAAPRIAAPNRWLTEIVLKAASRRNGVEDPVPLSALVRAGLVVDLESLRNLWLAANELSFSGQEREAFTAWCEYARRVPAQPLKLAREALNRPTAPGNKVAGAIMGLREIAITRAVGDTGNLQTPIASERLEFLQPDRDVAAGASRVVIFAGGAPATRGELDEKLEQLLSRALLRFRGLILTAQADGALPLALRAAAAPDVWSAAGTAADRSSPGIRLHHRPSGDAAQASLAMWADLVLSNFPLGDVRVVTFPGGPLGEQEIALALTMGATVVSVGNVGKPSSRDDQVPLGADDVLDLPVDPMTLRAFLTSSSSSSLDGRLRHHVARFIHEDYREKQQGKKPPEDVALAPWERLTPALQHSNLAQADDIPNKLALIGKRVIKEGESLQLTDAELELLAEIEHGRFNYERLSTGWALGQRYVERHVSPHLKPWAELDNETKQWDRDAVCNIGPALIDAGWGVESLSASRSPQ
jgi:voltage-gated potassium channel Kch